ncbi:MULTISPECIES: D-2-hydroxyacid dehydrogenase [unclassified Gordonia (in: high G+C Gram-positive bacteria)]|uniref:D-2-hydroxyacid dehydrogenase n=1 Tax=unclassified Gordonia (in: high G+C Gram-positive bacteria) TaxID=2657482 RepID=UPI001F0D146F|nr:D-2-hydroxyacid dehydrogenase [Gordonia sp. ABSL49_1]MCH5643831.1 D-2-hydroxyacid dehydrogenase [Gordonia sp. ABSL49_1]
MASDAYPVLVFLGADDVPPPYNLAELDQLADIRHCTADGLADALSGADILVLWDFFSRGLVDNWDVAKDSLRWVHVCAAGVDSLLFDDLVTSEVVVTNASGVFDRPIAEFVLGSILARDKRLHESMGFQRDHVWRHRETVATHRTSALVVGTGGIGRAIARLLRAVGVSVTGAGRVARTGDPDFGEVIATSDLADHIGAFDNVILVAPLTPQTERMVDARVLGAMKSGAHLVNVGRGQLVDESALVDAVRSGALGAASLDVFDDEPLAEDSPLWDMPGVSISAHMSGDVAGWRDSLADQILVNLRKYRDSDASDLASTLVNVVDKARGYVTR